MGINTAMIMGVQPTPYQSPLDTYARGIQLKGMIDEQKAAGEARQRQATLRDLLPRESDPMKQGQLISQYGDPVQGAQFQSTARKQKLDQYISTIDILAGVANEVINAPHENKQALYQQRIQELRAKGIEVGEDTTYPGDETMVAQLQRSQQFRQEAAQQRDKMAMEGAREYASNSYTVPLRKAVEAAAEGKPYDPRFKRQVEAILSELRDSQTEFTDPSGAVIRPTEQPIDFGGYVTSYTNRDDPEYMGNLAEGLLVSGRHDLAQNITAQTNAMRQADPVGAAYAAYESARTPEEKELRLKHLKKLTEHAPPMNVNVGKVEQSARIESNKDFREKEYRPVQERAAAARKANALIDMQERLKINDKTGWTTGAQGSAARLLAAMGVQDADKFAADYETFQNILEQQAWTKLEAQKGVQTEGDAERARNVFARINNRPQANAFIRDMHRAMHNREIAKSKFYNKNYDKAQDEGDIARLERMWAEEEDDMSIFNDPVMKKWQRIESGTPPGAASEGLSDVFTVD